MKKILGFCGLTGIILVSYLINLLGVFVEVPEFLTEYSNCEYLTEDQSIYGPEDAVIYKQDVLLGITSHLHTLFSGIKDLYDVQRGQIFVVYGLSTGKFVKKMVKINNYPDVLFNPHGIYIRRPNYLHVINHSFSSGGERVDSFKIIETEQGDIELDYQDFTLMGEHMNGVTNDLAFISADRFVISNWMPFPVPVSGPKDQSVFQIIRYFFGVLTQKKQTYAWDCKYVKGGQAECVVLTDGRMINGIEFDGQNTLAVADTTARLIHIYNLLPNGQLSLVQSVPTVQLPDNLSYDYVRKQFISGGLSTPFQFLNLEPILPQVLENKTKKSKVLYPALVETIKQNSQNKYESSVLLSCHFAIFGISGALLDESANFLILTSFVDKSIAICPKNK